MIDPPADPPGDPSAPPQHPGWEPLPYERLPRPTYFPAGLSMGTAFIFWGFITSWVIFLVGLGLFFASLAGWITAIRHDHDRKQP